jgi:hypothetical protein
VRCAAAKPRVNAEKPRFFINAQHIYQYIKILVDKSISLLQNQYEAKNWKPDVISWSELLADLGGNLLQY